MKLESYKLKGGASTTIDLILTRIKENPNLSSKENPNSFPTIPRMSPKDLGRSVYEYETELRRLTSTNDLHKLEGQLVARF